MERRDPKFFDIELYPNYLLIVFQSLATGKIRRFQLSPNTPLDKQGLLDVLKNNLIVGFNSKTFDVPIIQLALAGSTIAQLKEAANDIIEREMRLWDFCKKHNLQPPGWDHVDLIEVCPLKGSLKLYGARLHCRKIQDLPIDPNTPVTAEQAEQLYQYCLNDLDVTRTIWLELEGQIALREALGREYGTDLRSLSDAQIAERVISAEVAKINRCKPQRPSGLEGTVFRYQVPGYIAYKLPALQDMLAEVRESDFKVLPTGSVTMPDALANLTVRIGKGEYRLGIGGLHSSETCVSHVADENTYIIDRDVASYYPRIILSLGLYPKHLGEAFTKVFNDLVERRLVAKKTGDKVTAESLKITINGGGGKFLSKWSVLYAPEMFIQMTLTGQLSLLLLIEMIELAGIPVVSANTDGIVIKCPKAFYDRLMRVIADWERATGFTTEETRYRSIHCRDVNSYLAIKTDGSVKGKGAFSEHWSKDEPSVFKFHRNPSMTITIEAVAAFLRDGTPLEKTIRECRDIRKFVCVRSVTGGASKAEEYVGKVVRWIYTTDDYRSVLRYRKSGNKVPKSQGSTPMMELPDPDDFPTSLNYDMYLAEAKSMLKDVGYGRIQYQQSGLFEDAA